MADQSAAQDNPKGGQRLDQQDQVATLATRFDKLESDIRADAKELKQDAKDQKSYTLIGVFILGVMVATMLIIVGGMVYGAYLNQSSTDNQLNSNINILLQKLNDSNSNTIINGTKISQQRGVSTSTR